MLFMLENRGSYVTHSTSGQNESVAGKTARYIGNTPYLSDLGSITPTNLQAL